MIELFPEVEANCPLNDKMIRICNATHQHLVQEIVRLSEDVRILQADVNIYKPAFLSLVVVLGSIAIFLVFLLGSVKRRSRIKQLLGREEFVREVKIENAEGVHKLNNINLDPNTENWQQQKLSVCTVASIDDVQKRLQEVEEGEDDGQRYGARRKVATNDIGTKLKTYESQDKQEEGSHRDNKEEGDHQPQKGSSSTRPGLERGVSKKSLPAKLTDLYQHIPEDYEKDLDMLEDVVPNICITRPSIDSRASTAIGLDEKRTTFAGNTKFDKRKRSISMNN